MTDVLVVDEDVSITNSVNSLLTLEGIAHICCNSQAEALDCLRNNPSISVVLSDHAYSTVSDIDLLAHIRQDYPELSVIILTAFTEAAALQQLINQRKVDHLIFKPWHNDQLLEVINSHIHFAHHRQHTAQKTTLYQDKCAQLKAEVIERDRLLSMCLNTQHRYEQVLEYIPLACLVLSNENLIIVSNSLARSLLHLNDDSVGRQAELVLPAALLSAATQHENSVEIDVETLRLLVKSYLLTDEFGTFGNLLVLEPKHDEH